MRVKREEMSMTNKEKLKDLIDNAKKPTIYEWVYDVETFLNQIKKQTKESATLIANIKQ